MSKFLALSPEDKQNAILASETQHSNKLPAYIIEKDYWVWQTLKILYTEIAPLLSEKCDKPFLFKGGTSLSKGYSLINRMSEDIDLAFSLPLLGASPIDPTVTESRKGREKIAEDIDKKAEELIQDFLKNELTNRLQALDPEVQVEIESNKPLNIAIYYPKSLAETHYGGAVQPRVLLETGGRSDSHPDEIVSITHMLGEAIPDLADSSFDVLVLSPQRTMLEKMFGIHTNNIKETVGDKHARHLYDIVEIDKANPDWCSNKELFMTVVDFSDHYYRWPEQPCSTARSGPLVLSPKTEVTKKNYQDDWEAMADMFPQATLPYEFDELIKYIEEIEEKTNKAFYT